MMKEDLSKPTKSSDDVKHQDTYSCRPRIFMVILAIVFAFVIGGAYGHMLRVDKGLKTLPSPSITPSSIKTLRERRLIMEKEIEGGRIAAYRLGDDLSEDLNAGVFVVILEAGKEYHPAIFSISSPAYSEEGVFEIVGSELWLVNGQTNKIDVFNYQPEKRDGTAIRLSSLIYKDSINLPKYRIGRVYSIKCDKENCLVSSAHHQESGCRTNLNLLTRQFSNIKCSSRGRDFNPEPLLPTL